jgi:hypothetical protein
VWCTVGFFQVNQVDANGRIYLGQELNRAENKHVRHRMFSILDRSAFQNVFSTTATQVQSTVAGSTAQTAITAAGQWTVTPAAMSGTTTATLTGATQQWNAVQWSIQPGTVLRIGGGEEVVVQSVTATTFTANFTAAHAAGFSIQGLGNPGPAVNFNPHSAAASPVVAHFSIIE